MIRSLLATAFLIPGLTAQAPFKATDYLPDDYRMFVKVDLAALRDQGVWEGLEAGPVKMVFGMMEKEAGFALDALDRVTLCAVFEEGRDENDRRDPNRIVVLEGNQPLGVPDSVANNSSWHKEAIGGQEIWRLASHEEVFFQPRPEVRVEGSLALVKAPLEGKPHQGMPCADVLSLQSTRKQAFVHYGIDAAAPMVKREMLGKIFEGVEWPEGDAPQYLYGRVYATGEQDDPHVGLEVVVRHKNEGAGLATTEKALDALFAKVAANPQMMIVKGLLANVQRKRDRGDLVLTLDLGRTRDAAGKIAMIAMPLMMVGTTPQAAEVAAPAQTAPAEPEKKK
ncbi:MAG: hypothetical protein U1E73_08015 [Planctomycetota bacterium]